MKAQIVFFGTANFSAPSLEALITGGYPIKAVVTKPDRAVGRSRKPQPPRVKDIAHRHGIQVLQPENPNEISNELQNMGSDMGIVVSYGRILPATLLALFPKGLLNAHASLLPKYRGASPIEQTILNGDQETGVTLMRLTAEMDAGPVYAQQVLPLQGTETRIDLHHQLSELGAKLLLQKLEDITTGELKPEPQNDSLATYAPKINKNDGLIDPNRPAVELARQIRAYLGWPGSRTQLLGKEATILEATAKPDPLAVGKVTTSEGKIVLGTSQGSLQILRLKPASRREMTAREFLRGQAA